MECFVKKWVFILLTVLATFAARAQTTCSGAFDKKGLSQATREAYSQKLRDFLPATEYEIQSDADFRRRLVQHLFIDTQLFMKDLRGKFLSPAPKVEEEALGVWINDRIAALEKVYGKLEEVIATDKTVMRFAMDQQVSAEKAEQVLNTFLEMKEDSARGARNLFEILKQVEKLAEAREEGLRAQVHRERGTRALQERSSGGGLAWLAGIGSGLAAWGAWGGMGHMIPFLQVSHDWCFAVVPPAISTALLYDFSTPIHRLRGAYRRFQEKRGLKVATHSIQEIKEKHTDEEEAAATDAAFEKGWEEWKVFALQGEGSRNRTRTERLSQRVNTLGLLISEMNLWQLPNGESYSAVRQDNLILSTKRMKSLQAGIERKMSQVNIFLEELDWLEKDLQTPENISNLEDAPGARELRSEIRQNLSNTIGVFRQSLQDRLEELAVEDTMLDLGEASYRKYIEAMDAKLRRRRGTE